MNQKTIGLFGTIGYDDYGDDALLICNVEELQKRSYEIIIFSQNIAKTTNILISNGLLPVNGISNQIKIVKDLNSYVDEKNLLNYLDFPIDFFLNKYFNTKLDVFKTLYYKYLHYKLTNCLNGISGKNEFLSQYLNDLSKCSLILFMGGGYFNKYHGVKIYSHITALSLMARMGKKTVAYGQTFGPLSQSQTKFVKKYINKLDHVSVRDVERSKERLIELGYNENQISEGPDDAIFLKSNDDYNDIFKQLDGKYLVITNFGLFLKYSKIPLVAMYSIFANFLDYIIETNDGVILNISMTSSGIDIKQGLEIQKRMKYKNRFYHQPLYTSVKDIKAIIGKSDLIFSSRLHPIVFAISEKKSYIGISSGGEYYDSKLRGISEIYGYDPNKHIINADDLSLAMLIQLFNDAINDQYVGDEKIYEINKLKRKNDLDALYNKIG